MLVSLHARAWVYFHSIPTDAVFVFKNRSGVFVKRGRFGYESLFRFKQDEDTFSLFEPYTLARQVA